MSGLHCRLWSLGHIDHKSFVFTWLPRSPITRSLGLCEEDHTHPSCDTGLGKESWLMLVQPSRFPVVRSHSAATAMPFGDGFYPRSSRCGKPTHEAKLPRRPGGRRSIELSSGSSYGPLNAEWLKIQEAGFKGPLRRRLAFVFGSWLRAFVGLGSEDIEEHMMGSEVRWP